MSLVDAGIAPEAWRRVHPMTPLLNVGGALFIIVAGVFVSNLETLLVFARSEWVSSRGVVFGILLVLAALLFVALIVGIYGYLSWRKTMFAVTDDAVWYRHGIIFRNQRHARVERIQAVTIYHPLFGRIVGVGKLRVEVAGSAESSFTIQYLRSNELELVRQEILGRTTKVDIKQAAGEEGPFPAAVEEETPLYRVPLDRLVGGASLSPWVVLVTLGFVAVVGFTVFLALVDEDESWGSSILLALPALLGLVFAGFLSMSGSVNFRASVAPTGIRVKRGLLNTSAETIPPRRIHAVKITQPLLWRPFGWYRVTITQIGGTHNNSQKSSGDLLLPVGTKQDALLALWLVVPDLGVPNPNELLQAALSGSGSAEGFTTNPPISMLFDPLVYRRRGVRTTSTCAIIRDGFLRRTVTVVPYARMQSVGWKQGPWQRCLHLATLNMHVVPGSITPRVKHLGQEDSKHLMDVVVENANFARLEETPDHWLDRAKCRLEATNE